MGRYSNRITAINKEISYSDVFRNRGINFIKQYSTPEFYEITTTQRANLKRLSDVWKQGDKLWKYAAIHYGDARMWWVIAWYNYKPTDAHFNIGDTILIPFPLERVLSIFEGVS